MKRMIFLPAIFLVSLLMNAQVTIDYFLPKDVTPLLSGYCTMENIERIKGTPFASIHGSRNISLYDNTNFRAIWYGTNKIFLNAVFFGQILGRTGAEYGE